MSAGNGPKIKIKELQNLTHLVCTLIFSNLTTKEEVLEKKSTKKGKKM